MFLTYWFIYFFLQAKGGEKEAFWAYITEEKRYKPAFVV
jgi:hypothetical protein